MSVEQVESAILALSPEDRARLLGWLSEHRHDLFANTLTDAQKSEILRRRQEYHDRPEMFTTVAEAEDLNRFFENIHREVQARVSSSRKG